MLQIEYFYELRKQVSMNVTFCILFLPLKYTHISEISSVFCHSHFVWKQFQGERASIKVVDNSKCTTIDFKENCGRKKLQFLHCELWHIFLHCHMPRSLLTSHSVDGMVKAQSTKSEMANVTMKTFLAVLIRFRPKTAMTMRTLPKNPTMMAMM